MIRDQESENFFSFYKCKLETSREGITIKVCYGPKSIVNSVPNSTHINLLFVLPYASVLLYVYLPVATYVLFAKFNQKRCFRLSFPAHSNMFACHSQRSTLTKRILLWKSLISINLYCRHRTFFVHNNNVLWMAGEEGLLTCWFSRKTGD